MKLNLPSQFECPSVVWLWRWLLFAGLIFIAPELSGAEPPPVDDAYSIRTWQVEDGLPDNRVVAVVQASDGFLWVATQGSLLRFDGVRFQRVDVAGAPGRIAGTMRVLIRDRNGQIWLAKEEGDVLFCFNGGHVTQVSPDQGLPKNERQYSMAVDGDGCLWVGYNSGKVIRYNRDGKVDFFTSKDGLPDGGVCWLASGRDGILWFAKQGRVGVFRDGRFSVLKDFGSAALQIAPARSGGIWICVNQRILKFDQGKEMVELGRLIPASVRELSRLEPTVLLEDRSGAVWVGTASAGLYRCASNSIVRVEVSNPGILGLAEDREGNLWVGTRGGGLNRVRRRVTFLINAEQGLPFEGVQSVCQDAAGELWAVGDNGVLVRGHGTNWVVQSPASSPEQAFVTCAAAGTNGSVWIGTRGGSLYRWDAGRSTDLGLRDRLRGRSVRSLLVARNGDLWIGTDASDVLYCLCEDRLQSFGLPTGHRFIRAMAEDAAGNFWAGASDGMLMRVVGNNLTDETTNSGSLSIRCLYPAKSGDLWIGYAGAGVGRFRKGNIVRFSTDQGLPNDYVSQILEDGRGGIWFAGNRGIFQVREQDFDKVTAGIATRVWPVLYGRSEGVPGLQASFDYWPTAVHALADQLFFSMLSGLAEVRLADARLNNRPPPVLIERAMADGRTLAVYQNFSSTDVTNTLAPLELDERAHRDELRVPPGQQQVQFEFTALSLVASENVQFRYQLEGLDEAWVDAGPSRTATYTHPPAGHYQFKVIACNNDGVWNQTGDELAVIIEPYIWETVWFKLTAAVVSFGTLAGLLIIFLRRRHRSVVERLEHQRALEEERTRIARDLHDDLGVGLTEIGLLGDLAIAGADTSETSRNRVQEITGRARSLAASLDEIVWAINPANSSSQSLVDYFFPYTQKLLGSAGIRCRLEVVEPLPHGNFNSEKRHEFFRAYREALNNIIRHSRASQVKVSMSAVEGSLQIRIADNGRGLVLTGGKGAHHGLVGMRERLLRLGGSCEIISPAGGGTTVTFIIPV